MQDFCALDKVCIWIKSGVAGLLIAFTLIPCIAKSTPDKAVNFDTCFDPPLHGKIRNFVFWRKLNSCMLWWMSGTILAAEQGWVSKILPRGPRAQPEGQGPRGRILLAQPSSAARIIILVLPTECWDTSLRNKYSVRL